MTLPEGSGRYDALHGDEPMIAYEEERRRRIREDKQADEHMERYSSLTQGVTRNASNIVELALRMIGQLSDIARFPIGTGVSDADQILILAQQLRAEAVEMDK